MTPKQPAVEHFITTCLPAHPKFLCPIRPSHDPEEAYGILLRSITFCPFAPIVYSVLYIRLIAESLAILPRISDVPLVVARVCCHSLCANPQAVFPTTSFRVFPCTDFLRKHSLSELCRIDPEAKGKVKWMLHLEIRRRAEMIIAAVRFKTSTALYELSSSVRVATFRPPMEGAVLGGKPSIGTPV